MQNCVEATIFLKEEVFYIINKSVLIVYEEIWPENILNLYLENNNVKLGNKKNHTVTNPIKILHSKMKNNLYYMW